MIGRGGSRRATTLKPARAKVEAYPTCRNAALFFDAGCLRYAAPIRQYMHQQPLHALLAEQIFEVWPEIGRQRADRESHCLSAAAVALVS